jgi:hypothetical protein
MAVKSLPALWSRSNDVKSSFKAADAKKPGAHHFAHYQMPKYEINSK